MNLQEIGYKYGTDKSSGNASFNGRTSLDFYEKYFEPFRDSSINFLELGILDGKSLRTWEEYFPNAKISALDVDPSRQQHESDRTKVYIGSQDDPEVIGRIKSDNPDKFDVILDDASHINELTIATFNLLFDHVKAGGLYIIEDVGCSYGDELHGSFEYFARRWTGMQHNRSNINYNNRRSQIDEFLLPKIKELDLRRGNIYSFHFYASTLIIEKAR